MPLPASFRLTAGGAVVPDVTEPAGAQGAGGGTGRGPVHVGPDPAPGTVLVVRTLDPSLAPVLPGLAGLVAETGSPLSHLAILAREHGVPTVVGLAGALDTFAPGVVVDVDGTAGTVAALEHEPGEPGEAIERDGLGESADVIVLPAPQAVGWPAATPVVDRLTAVPGTAAAAAISGAIRAQAVIRAQAHIPPQDLTGGER